MSRIRWSTLLFAGLLGATWLASRTAEAVIVRHDRALAQTLELGARFPFVCAAGGGSGTLIGPRWVLTAAHVVEEFSPFDYQVRCAGREVAVARVFLHPGEEEMPWDRRTDDVALLYLEQSVEGIAPATLYRGTDQFGEMQELGKTGVMAGVGFFGSAGTRPREKDGRTRAVTNRISDLEERWLKTVFSRPPGGSDLEGLCAAGDSGGPLLVEADEGPLVVGVSAYAEYIDAEGGEETYGAMDYFTRVSSYVGWIDGVIEAVEEGRVVPSEGEEPGEIRTALDGPPPSVVGKRATAYFEAFNSGEAQAFAEFTREHRTPESLLRSSMEERLESYRASAEEWGQLRVVHYAVTGPRKLYVQVRSDVGLMVFGFEVEAEAPQRLASISLSY